MNPNDLDFHYAHTRAGVPQEEVVRRQQQQAYSQQLMQQQVYAQQQELRRMNEPGSGLMPSNPGNFTGDSQLMRYAEKRAARGPFDQGRNPFEGAAGRPVIHTTKGATRAPFGTDHELGAGSINPYGQWRGVKIVASHLDHPSPFGTDNTSNLGFNNRGKKILGKNENTPFGTFADEVKSPIGPVKVGRTPFALQTREQTPETPLRRGRQRNNPYENELGGRERNNILYPPSYNENRGRARIMEPKYAVPYGTAMNALPNDGPKPSKKVVPSRYMGRPPPL